MPGFLMAADEQIAKEAKNIFTKEPGCKFCTGINIKSVKASKKNVTINYNGSIIRNEH